MYSYTLYLTSALDGPAPRSTHFTCRKDPLPIV